MEKPFTVIYTNPDTEEEYQQTFYFEEDVIQDLYNQMRAHTAGKIQEDTPLFNLFTGIKFISKLQGFQRTPNFMIVDEDFISIGGTPKPRS